MCEAAGQPAVCWTLQGNPSSSGRPGLDGVVGPLTEADTLASFPR